MSPARGPYQRRPHPMEPQIRPLIAQGLNNAQIIEELNAPPKVVAKVRADMGIAPAPRSTWRRKPHPKAREIRELLEDGHTDAEIRRRTGADVKMIARMRAEGSYGKATITIRKPRRHPRETEIRALLREHSNAGIASLLRVDRAAVRRIRKQAGIPCPATSYATPEEKWQAHVRPVDGGHLEWTGEHGKVSGTPAMRHKGASYSPAAIAFRIRRGRDPQGYVKSECGFKQCVAPDHVDDEAGRLQVREQLRYVMGGKERRPHCVRGHEQAVHGRYEPDGRAYCEACKVDDKRSGRAGVAA
ncbi:hypothetical protein ACFXKY_07750 [Streptomyces canus]|uniref:hypothetical protein n=1 Tax=Streptomyces canus TaxID=58343 RepID=UPI0036B1D9F1